MKTIRSRKGVSVTEMLIASAIAVIVIGSIIMLNEFSQRIWTSEKVKSDLVGKLQIAMEKMQKEIRSTDAHQIFYYPSAAATYTAISFPIAVDSNGDGFIDVTAADPPKIDWTKTVIYHIYNNTSTGKIELRRTFFNNRQHLTDVQRQSQLDDVALNGYPTLTLSPEYPGWDPSTGTRALIDGSNVTLAITPAAREFDGYSASTVRSDNVAFGSIPLTSGGHYITFTAIGKNDSSVGYNIGIDYFSVTPSGSAIEAEEASVRDDGGSAKISEDMRSYGSWSGNRQLEYQTFGLTDHISFNFYYDQWFETNFTTCLLDYTDTPYDNKTGDWVDGVPEETGPDDYIALLGGLGDAWFANDQTGASDRAAYTVNVAGGNGIIFRDVIINPQNEGRAIKITIDNVSSESITIDYAGIMEQQSGPDGNAGTIRQVSFDGGSYVVTVPAGQTKVSDWVDINAFNKDKTYLLSLHCPFAAGSHSVSGSSISDVSTQSYVLDGAISAAQDAVWEGIYAYSTSDVSYSARSIMVSYFSGGTLRSQIYDTGMDDPSYGTIAWNIAKNNYGQYATGGLGANLILRVRSGDDRGILEANNDWSATLAVDTQSVVSGSFPINSIGNGRYVQFQAEFFSLPTPGFADYVKSCVLRNVTINWPGQERVVDISGRFTQRPNYGIFSVAIDGYSLTKGIEVLMTVSDSAAGGVAITRTLAFEAEPRNTGR